MSSASADNMTDWLLAGLELKSTVFHVGQYCGTWQASTAGRHLASFHVVLYGECWLHLAAAPGREAQSIRLGAGDAAFLLRDVPHCLSPSAEPPPPGSETARVGAMSPLEPDAARALTPDGVGIACGFFEFASALDGLLVSLLPERIVARHGHPSLAGARTLFGLIRDEALRDADSPSPVLARLTSLLFVYALRALGHDERAAPSFWRLMRDPAFAPLASAIVESPARPWTTQTMAAFVHMSRSRFCRRFGELSGQPPAQFLALVRMKLAAAMLAHGASMAEAAERVGYRSESAFAQAFRRVTGVQPGSWRRSHPSAHTPRPTFAAD
ncbi:AraC family transcriptional regulator [Burkholderia sp. WAC0059]|uniref:AraC family transcriptional regulator n=1 Tax=Burkholderia sp. WAC0059 TaxID=2066022 RepID=UPI000C7F12B8|nr:AraC family transcriptional regulator [Burkholderia sp. WAC0059]PLZ03126.1 AraC family transcriptional regulator [Burkholderia sp. WAC0059]